MKETQIDFFNIKDTNYRFDHLKILNENPAKHFSHTHDIIELLYLVKAEGYYFAEDQQYKLRSGTLIITPPSTYHRLSLSDYKIYERYNFCFNQNFIDAMDVNKIFEKIKVIHCSEQSNISQIFKRADYYHQNLTRKEFRDLSQHLAKEIFYNLVIYGNSHDADPGSVSPILSEAIEYINNNLYTIKNVSEVSNHVHVTDCYLFEIFRKHLKTSPKKYINTKRLHAAKNELLLGVKPIDVYLKVGFNNYTTFYKSFYNFFNCAPSEAKDIKFSNEMYG